MSFIFNLPSYPRNGHYLEELTPKQRISVIDNCSNESLVPDVLQLVSNFLSPVHEMEWIWEQSEEMWGDNMSKRTFGDSGIKLWAMEMPNICRLHGPAQYLCFWFESNKSTKPLEIQFDHNWVRIIENGATRLKFNCNLDVWPEKTAGYCENRDPTIVLTFFIDDSQNCIFFIFTTKTHHRIGTPFYCKLPANWQDCQFCYRQNVPEQNIKVIKNATPCFSEFR
jgi:hypothetical protein